MNETRNPTVGARRGARRQRAQAKAAPVDAAVDENGTGDAPGGDRTGEEATTGTRAGATTSTGTGDAAATSTGTGGAAATSTGTDTAAAASTGTDTAAATSTGTDTAAATSTGTDIAAESTTETGDAAATSTETDTAAATSSEAADNDSDKGRTSPSSARAKRDGDTGPRRSGRARQPAKGPAKGQRKGQGKARTGKPKGGKRKPAGRRPRSEGRRRGTWSGELELSDGGLAVADADGKLLQYAPAKVASSLRYLLARLERDPGVGLPKRVAFTSVLSGEGVSVVARSFAAVLAHDTGRSVCVVDLNWWSADEAPRGGQAEPHGLYEVLWMEKSLEAVLSSTQTPELFYLHAGSAPESVRPMLAHHPRLGATLDELASRFDHLVVDLPAVGARSEAIGLSQLCDWVVLVIQQGVPSRKQLQSALADLGETRPVAAVLNRSESSIPSFVRRLLGL